MIARVAKALNKKDGDKGFTLVELLVVIIIIGILAAVAIPVFLNQRAKGYDAQVKSDLKNAALVAETNYVDTLTFADEDIFAEGKVAGNELASGNASYVGIADADSYTIYGTSQSGNVFVLDSDDGGTPEPFSGTIPAAAGSGEVRVAWP